jgi:hypothetical protein
VFAPGIELTPSRRRGRGCCGRRRLCSAKGSPLPQLVSARQREAPNGRRLPSKAEPARPQGSAVPGARGCRTATHLRGRRCQRLVAVSGRVRHGDVRMHRERKRERGGKPGRNELPETRRDPKLCLKLVQFLEFSRSHFSSRCCSCSGPQGVRSGGRRQPRSFVDLLAPNGPSPHRGPALGSHSDYRRSRSCSSIARSGLTKSLHPAAAAA